MALEYIPTEHQNADIFTKPLDRSKFQALHQVIGVILGPQSSLVLLVLMLHLTILCDHSSLLFLFSLFLGFALHNIHAFHAWLFQLILFKIIKKKKKEKEGKICFALFFLDLKLRLATLSLHNLCTLFSLDELILLHLASFSFVVYVV